MKRSGCATLVLTVLALGCTSPDRPETEGQAPKTNLGQALDEAAERESLDALRALGANVALDGQGRPKVLRLSGPKVTDATLQHVAALTSLQALYLEGTKVTDAGMAQLKGLTKLQTLHCTTVDGAAKVRLLAALKEPTMIECTDTPVVDLLDLLQDYHDIRITIDPNDPKAGELARSTPVTAKKENVPLEEALTSILQPLGFEWTLGSGGGLVVTTEEGLNRKYPGLGGLRQAVPALKDVRVDW